MYILREREIDRTERSDNVILVNMISQEEMIKKIK